mmetsp:Transcript_6373/g.14944  ORF Transcript_6373/g.14944 Transcript_6373/m.14944 type:complete len:624 (-) Transcript_6373:68-1939(-)
MFWRLGFAHSSPVEQLLETGVFTLQQLLEEDDIIQECKQLNKKLIDFLALPEQVQALIDYVVTEPAADSEDKVKFIYPYKSSEVLSADLSAVYDCMFANEELLNKLFTFLEAEAPLNTLLAGYFGKIVSTLLARRPEETLKVLQKRNVIPLLLRHVGSYSILELLLKVVSEAEENASCARIDWLYQEDLVGQLIDKLDPALDSEVHANASVALVGFINQQQQMQWAVTGTPLKLVTALQSPESVRRLLERMLAGGSSTLDHGLTVLVELVRSSASQGAQRTSSNEVSPLIAEVLKQLNELVNVLRKPPPMTPIVNTTGKLDPPLGSNRLKILEVVHALVQLKLPAVEEAMISLKVMPTCLDLFFEFEWHNFLHNLVKSLLDMIVKGENEAFKRSLFTDANILSRIVDAHKKNDEAMKKPKACRKGYMGQLRLISNMIIQEATVDIWMTEYTGTEEWQTFMSTVLAPLNDIHDQRQLGCPKPHGVSGASDDEDDLPAHTTEEDIGDQGPSDFEFRNPDQPDQLFEQDEGWSADDEQVGHELDDDGDNEMELDSEQVGGDAGGPGEDGSEELSASVNAMNVDQADEAQPTPAPPKPKEEDTTEADLAEYNDINFWKPRPTWFKKD